MFKPNEYKKNVSEIDYEKLEKNGIKLLCFDVDNTLDYPDILTEKLLDMTYEVMKELEQLNFKILLVSNNSVKERVEKFANLVDKEYVYYMKKPFQKNYKNNKTINSYEPKQIAFIGDKMITDVLGGNRYGGYTILVDPLKDKGTKPHQKVMKFLDSIFCTIFGFKRGEYYE